MILPEIRSPGRDVGGAPRGGVEGRGVTAGTITFPGTGNYKACQSPSAFYSCEVRVLAPVDEQYDEIFNRLQNENCCKNSGGNVLHTKTGGC